MMEIIIDIAEFLGVTSIAEGVETEEQLAFVREIGCELVQGYYYHKPEPLEEILFRLHAGGTIKTYETQEERDRLNRKWFERNIVAQSPSS